METESFEIDPTPRSQHIVREYIQSSNFCNHDSYYCRQSDREEVMSWLHTHRLPLFWNCHLLYEYALCLELSKSKVTFLHKCVMPSFPVQAVIMVKVVVACVE